MPWRGTSGCRVPDTIARRERIGVRLLGAQKVACSRPSVLAFAGPPHARLLQVGAAKALQHDRGEASRVSRQRRYPFGVVPKWRQDGRSACPVFRSREEYGAPPRASASSAVTTFPSRAPYSRRPPEQSATCESSGSPTPPGSRPFASPAPGTGPATQARWGRAQVDLFEGQRAEAQDHCGHSPDGNDRALWLALVAQERGTAVEADQAVAALVQRLGTPGPVSVAVACAWRGNADRALEWLGGPRPWHLPFRDEERLTPSEDPQRSASHDAAQEGEVAG